MNFKISRYGLYTRSSSLRASERQRTQRGNPGEYSIYMYHNVLKTSLYKEFIFVIPTMDCRACSLRSLARNDGFQQMISSQREVVL